MLHLKGKYLLRFTEGLTFINRAFDRFRLTEGSFETHNYEPNLPTSNHGNIHIFDGVDVNYQFQSVNMLGGAFRGELGSHYIPEVTGVGGTQSLHLFTPFVSYWSDNTLIDAQTFGENVKQEICFRQINVNDWLFDNARTYLFECDGYIESDSGMIAIIKVGEYQRFNLLRTEQDNLFDQMINHHIKNQLDYTQPTPPVTYGDELITLNTMACYFGATYNGSEIILPANSTGMCKKTVMTIGLTYKVVLDISYGLNANFSNFLQTETSPAVSNTREVIEMEIVSKQADLMIWAKSISNNITIHSLSLRQKL